MTIKEAKNIVKALGYSLNKTQFGEYRVNKKGGKEVTAYYTTDLNDAVGTSKALAARERSLI